MPCDDEQEKKVTITFEPLGDCTSVAVDGVIAGVIATEGKAVAFIPDGTHIALMTSLYAKRATVQYFKRYIISRVKDAYELNDGEVLFVGGDAFLVRINGELMSVEFVAREHVNTFAPRHDAIVTSIRRFTEQHASSVLSSQQKSPH